MDLYTDTLGELEGITAATLEEWTTGEGVLNLEFAGWGPDWLGYMEPVSLYHQGSLIFHGKMVNFSHTNDGGAVRATAQVQNFFWLLERQTLGQQLAEIEEATEQVPGSGSAGEEQNRVPGLAIGGIGLQRRVNGQIGKQAARPNAVGHYVVNWANAVENMKAGGLGWKVPLQRDADDGVLQVRCSTGVENRQVWAVTRELVTTASALWRMRRKAPDVQYIVDYHTGTVTATGILEQTELVWNSEDGFLLAAEDIAPQYETQVTGVAIAWTNDEGVTEVHTWPEFIDMAQDGVKVFHLTGTYYVASWIGVAAEYYHAANVLQYGGSVRVRMAGVKERPLGRRLCLKGPGTHESWHTMQAIITHCSWDFMERTVTVQLGHELADPEFGDAEETEDGGAGIEAFDAAMEETSEGSGSGGGWPVISGSGSAGGGSGEPPQPGTGSASESGSESVSASASWSGSGACGCSAEWSALRSWQGVVEDRLDNLRECSCSHESRSDSGCDCSANWSRERRNNEELWRKLQELEMELRNVRQCSCSHEGSGSGSADGVPQVEQVYMREPDGCSPGVDGWAETWRGYVYSGNMNYTVLRRQLMRFTVYGGTVVLQAALQDFLNDTWESAL